MKKLLLIVSLTLVSVGAMAMSRSKIRTHARFLTDRMAYELDLTPMQYDDCYEINYDFIYAVSRVMDDVVFGYTDAIGRYYTYLDYRNEDLRYILTARQYVRFMASEYFYRPIYSTGTTWQFRVYTIYSNRKFFYFDAPSSYKSYRGEHSHTMIPNYFVDRFSHQNDRYMGDFRIHGNDKYVDNRKRDFGTNMKERQGTTYNNYKNPNSNNRTEDRRYRDTSGNQHSPEINTRNNTSTQSAGRRGTTTQSTTRQSTTNTSTRQTTTSRSTTGTTSQGTSRGTSTTQRSTGTSTTTQSTGTSRTTAGRR